MALFKKNFGYVEDPFDPRDVWLDEVFGGDEQRELPTSYHVDGLVYDKQGQYPYCVSFATTSVVEYLHKKETGKSVKLSPAHLFYASEGGLNGSSLRQNLNVVKDDNKGAIPDSAFPMPPNILDKPKDWFTLYSKKAKAVPFKDTTHIKGYARVLPFKSAIKKAILDTGPLLVGVYVSTKDGYYTGSGERKTDDDNHVVALTGWDDDKNVWYIHDSLRWVGANNGTGTLSQNYTFRYAYAITELPENWKQLRDESRKKDFEQTDTSPNPSVLDHYGKQRNFEKEQRVAVEMLDRFKAFNNKSVTDAAGRFWTIYINAIAYGGYSYTDIINDCYHWRRTGTHLFDFNYKTREMWFRELKGRL